MALGAQTHGELQTYVLLGPAPRYAALRGLLRSCRKEHPELRLRALTLVSGGARLPAVPMGSSPPCELPMSLDGGELLVRRIVPLRAPLTPPPEDLEYIVPTAPAASTAIVTGGLRGLGVRVARWLLEGGRARRVVLVGRSVPAAGSAAARDVDELVVRGAEVRRCDVSDAKQVAALPDAQLVVHCAGAIDDQLMRDVTAPRAAAVLSAKVAGTLHLRNRYGGGARLVCFSSSSAELGVVGQATYGAANAFVDELCGGDAIQWGGWAEAGMAADPHIKPLVGESCLAPTLTLILTLTLTLTQP